MALAGIRLGTMARKLFVGSTMVPVTDVALPTLEDFHHFLVHVPKTSGSFVFDQIVDMTAQSPAFPPTSPIPCDARTQPTNNFLATYPRHSKISRYAQHRCNLWMAEQPYTPLAQANYIILREPRAHVLSQYFHCKESINHIGRHGSMPSLEEWLEAWVNTMNDTTSFLSSHTYPHSLDKFRCYDPRDLQSRHAGIVPLRNTRTSYNHPKPAIPEDIDVTLSHIDPVQLRPPNASIVLNDAHALQEDLLKRFAVVGDMAYMTQTVCMIFVRYYSATTNTTYIPPSCSCNQDQSLRRNLKIHFYGHGVRHHGSTYPTTERETELIGKLTQYDQQLYTAAQQVFQKQLQEFEEEFGVTLCSGK